MKVNIGPYKDYIGPYQIMDKVFFWHDRYADENLSRRWDYKLHEKLSELLAGKNQDSWCSKLCEWIHTKRDRKIKIHIHKYDTWNMDTTLALIIVPLLKQLKETAHGSPMMTAHEQSSEGSSQLCFPFYAEGDKDAWKRGHEEWQEILDKMIWAFEQINTDWEQQFQSGKLDFTFVRNQEDNLFEVKYGPDNTYKYDYEGSAKHADRMQEGFDLFGKHYRNLWD